MLIVLPERNKVSQNMVTRLLGIPRVCKYKFKVIARGTFSFLLPEREAQIGKWCQKRIMFHNFPPIQKNPRDVKRKNMCNVHTHRLRSTMFFQVKKLISGKSSKTESRQIMSDTKGCCCGEKRNQVKTCH